MAKRAEIPASLAAAAFLALGKRTLEDSSSGTIIPTAAFPVDAAVSLEN